MYIDFERIIKFGLLAQVKMVDLLVGPKEILLGKKILWTHSRKLQLQMILLFPKMPW